MEATILILSLLQVQHEVLQKRREEKKASLDSIKRFKKGKGEKPSFLANKDDEDDFPVAAHRENRGDRKSGDWEKSKKRQMRVSYNNIFFLLISVHVKS